MDNSILVFLSRTVCAAIALFRTLFTLQRGINTWGLFYVNKLILALYRKCGVIGSLFFPKTKERDCCVVFRCANTRPLATLPPLIFPTALNPLPLPTSAPQTYWIVIIFIAMNAKYNIIHSALLGKVLTTMQFPVQIMSLYFL